MREAVYRPEFRQDSTETSTMRSMICPAWGMPRESSAATYEPLSVIDSSSQGIRETTTKIEPR